MQLRIRCINKDGGNHDNPHEAITNYGWIKSDGESGKSTRAVMVDFVGKEGNDAYVTDSYGHKAYCYVRTSSKGTKFLQTFSDGRYTNNLLNLPECK
jgi:hypothetical protein